ncbi:hypothetical protein D1AOALGA4SA_6357 [Olavius algarvensis Delta 1 endosymbiont]|nr:hypothetical protein D1AOALGA4SA_6357 [Olavius algarvensis Delta 1 endosymbiont]
MNLIHFMERYLSDITSLVKQINTKFVIANRCLKQQAVALFAFAQDGLGPLTFRQFPPHIGIEFGLVQGNQRQFGKSA